MTLLAASRAATTLPLLCEVIHWTAVAGVDSVVGVVGNVIGDSIPASVATFNVSPASEATMAGVNETVPNKVAVANPSVAAALTDDAGLTICSETVGLEPDRIRWLPESSEATTALPTCAALAVVIAVTTA
jgi:hypothetical protein